MIIAIIKETSETCYYLVLSQNGFCHGLEDEYYFYGESELENCPIEERPSGEECNAEVTVIDEYADEEYSITPIKIEHEI